MGVSKAQEIGINYSTAYSQIFLLKTRAGKCQTQTYVAWLSSVDGQIAMRAVTIVDDILFTVKQEHEPHHHRFVAYMKTRVHKPEDVKT